MKFEKTLIDYSKTSTIEFNTQFYVGNHEQEVLYSGTKKLSLQIKNGTVSLSQPFFGSRISGPFEMKNGDSLLKGTLTNYTFNKGDDCLFKVEDGKCNVKIYFMKTYYVIIDGDEYSFYTNDFTLHSKGKIEGIDCDWPREYQLSGSTMKKNLRFYGCFLINIREYYYRNYHELDKIIKVQENQIYKIYNNEKIFVSFVKYDDKLKATIANINNKCDNYFYTSDFTFFCVKHLQNSDYKIYVNDVEWTTLNIDTCRVDCKVDDDSQIILYIIAYNLEHDKQFLKQITFDDIEQVRNIVNTNYKSYKILKSKYYEFIKSRIDTQPNAPPLEQEGITE